MITHQGLKLTKDSIELAMRNTKSCKAAAQYLGVTLVTYKKYASMYYDEVTGETLYEKHKNPQGIGISKILKSKRPKSPDVFKDILAGKIVPVSYTAVRLKQRLLQEGLLKEECASCGFHERRVHDYKVPLLVTFRDGNKRNWEFSNLELLCYNCFYLQVGDVFNERQIAAIEDLHRPNKANLQEELELDDKHMQILDDLYDRGRLYHDPSGSPSGQHGTTVATKPDPEDDTGESIIFRMK